MVGMLDDEFPMMLEREAGMPDACDMVAVAFGLYPVPDKKESALRGTDWYRDVEYIKIAIPGDRNTALMQPADARYKARFPRAYEAFKKRVLTNITEGKPLNLWPPISRGLAWSLMAAHVQTVESLAQLTDEQLNRFPNAVREFRDKARAYLEDAATGAALNKAEGDKAELVATIQALQAQVQALQQADVARNQRESDANQTKAGKTKAA